MFDLRGCKIRYNFLTNKLKSNFSSSVLGKPQYYWWPYRSRFLTYSSKPRLAKRTRSKRSAILIFHA